MPPEIHYVDKSNGQHLFSCLYKQSQLEPAIETPSSNYSTINYELCYCKVEEIFRLQIVVYIIKKASNKLKNAHL